MTFLKKILANTKFLSAIHEIMESKKLKDTILANPPEDGFGPRQYLFDDTDEDETEKDDNEKTDEELIESYLEKKFETFTFEIEHSQNSGDSLQLYRCLSIPKEKLQEFLKGLSKGKTGFGFDGLGIYWSYNKEQAECHWAEQKFKNGDSLICEIEAPITTVDLFQTALIHCYDGSDEEAEIRLLKGAAITLLSVVDKKGKTLLAGPITIKA